MATATEAPATTTAEGPTQHVPNQPAPSESGQLTPAQVNFLLRGIDPRRVGEDGKGFAHVEAWDVRRHLIRIFGFGGFDTDLLEMTLVCQQEIPAGNRSRWTVVYRVAVKLTVKVDGVELGHWHGVATGDATNLPSLADAHDLALKTADSQALKRAATNMGDQFGLSLYNGGSPTPVVNAALPYMPPQQPAALPQDPPVKPEPGSPVGASAEADPAGSEAQHPTFDTLVASVPDCWENAIALVQLHVRVKESGFGSHRVQGPPPEYAWTTFDELLSARIAELNERTAQGGAEGSAA
ncbi:Rad52/Rad22 family DNA repair protein [Streptomyces sp. NPDC056069]|uniref:Rad52/Rad22 family DNA repair protein n=1 Tax=Streptomyces sp. NPDC056069 TaxID=3345702 RepID=UPI0035DD349B